MITVLKELFAEHGILEKIWSDNKPQFVSHLFAEFIKDWNIKHSTSSPMNPSSNRQIQSTVKIVEGLFTHAKCSVSIQKCPSWVSSMITCWDALSMCSMHNCASKDRAKDPHAADECERLEECAAQSAANYDHTCCHKKAPLCARHSVSVINNDRTLWFSVTVVHTAHHGSYTVKVIGGAEYR